MLVCTTDMYLHGLLQFKSNHLHTTFSSCQVYWPDGLPVSDLLKQFVQQQNPPSTIGFDQTYLINLQRRPDRLQKMDHALEILGIDYTLIEAVDGT